MDTTVLVITGEHKRGEENKCGEVTTPLFNDILPDAPASSPANEEIRHVSLDTQNALYRSILSSYANGMSDQGALALFALECPDEATRAVEAYQAQTNRIVEAVQEFLLGGGDNVSAFEREMDRLLRLRGANSRPSSGVVDARGSRRRR